MGEQVCQWDSEICNHPAAVFNNQNTGHRSNRSWFICSQYSLDSTAQIFSFKRLHEYFSYPQSGYFWKAILNCLVKYITAKLEEVFKERPSLSCFSKWKVQWEKELELRYAYLCNRNQDVVDCSEDTKKLVNRNNITIMCFFMILTSKIILCTLLSI